MAKAIKNHGYTLDVTANTLVLPGFYKLEDLFLITNVTTNAIIYNFADSAAGGAVAFDTSTEKTTLTFDLDLSTLSPAMANTDRLQIIYDEGAAKIDVHDSLLDPVHKIRVSTPENLIDTDFEYGLQPTKWETLELSNNVPSFYVSDGDLSLSIVTSVESAAGSEIITVYCSEQHNLPVGTPIDVQGLASRTAEGKFLISTVPNNTTFTYRALATQTITGVLGSLYTTITPGTFYTGSQIPFDAATGVVTDETEPASKITVTTEDPHGFAVNNLFYLLNSIGGKAIKLTSTTTDTAADGRPVVDFVDTLTFTSYPDRTKTETRQMKSQYSHKFLSTDVDTSANTIAWTSHGLKTNDVLFYMPPVYDTTIGGLNKFDRYYVVKINDNAISLTQSYNGAAITFSSAGTSYFGTHSLHLAYEIKQNYYPSYNSFSYHRTRYAYNGTGSGWDLNGTPLGEVSGQTVWYIPFSNTSPYHYSWQNYYTSGYVYAPWQSSNFNFITSGGVNEPNRYNIFEDWTRFSNNSHRSYTVRSGTSIRTQKYYYSNPYNYYWSTRYFYPSDLSEFFVPMVEDSEGDSLFMSSHGLVTGDSVTLTTQSATYGGFSGTNALDQHVGSTSSTNTTALSTVSDGDYTVDVISDDRFKLSGVRLSGAKGYYKIDGTKRNATANSFYLANHGLSTGTDVTVTQVDGGTLPTTTSGTVLPNSSTATTGTNVISFSTLNSFFTSYFSSSGAAGTSGLQDITTATNENSTRVFNSGVSSGSSSMDYYDLMYSSNYVYYSGYGGYNFPSANLYLKNLSSTRGYNIGAGTPLAGRNNIIVATDWSPNTTIDRYLWTRESGRASTSEYWYGYLRSGLRTPYQGSYNANSTWNNQTFTVGGKTYRWSMTYAKHTWGSYDPVIYMHGYFQNTTDWAIQNANTSMNRSSDSNYYTYSYMSSSYGAKDVVEFALLIKLANGQTWGNSSADYKTMFEAMLTNWNTNYIYPALTSGNTYDANVLTSDRISLLSGQNSVNLTDAGAANIEFKTKAELGVTDGTYAASAVAERTFDFTGASKIFGTTIELDATTVNSDYQINVAASGSHTIISGTKVTYDNNSNPTLANLVQSTDYYARAVDEKWLTLHATEAAAVNNESPIEITAGTGTHKVSTKVIAGRAQANGTVKVEAGSNVLKGTTTLFKRYFKPGDTVYVKDSATDPGELVERVVTSIADDTKMTVNQPYDFTNATTTHFLETKVYAKPDGYSVHRPFDGGVEIAAGTSPFSQVTRQTRKYFRYQSGKGIQTSLAINFNPPVTMEKLTGVSGATPTDVTYAVVNAGAGAYSFTGGSLSSAENPVITLYRGATYTFNVTASGHPFYLTTDDGSGFGVGTYAGEYTTGVTGSRTASGTLTFVVPSNAPNMLYYQCANHSAMKGVLVIADFQSTTGTVVTKYPHRLKVGSAIKVNGASDAVYNVTSTVSEIVNDFSFKYGLTTDPTSTTPTGIIKYNLDGYSGAFTRAGMFDSQNGFFFEFDGTVLRCCRRASTTQLSGTVTLVNNSGLVTGDSAANFTGQLQNGDFIVLRGQSYKITKLESKNTLYIQPQFKGISTSGVIVTKTEDVKVAQVDWNIDPCDGTGPDGFILDKNKIQMAYMDYSWYGAGKIRFGFKDMKGHIRYVHEFIHNNRLDEAYMRSGNLPAKYEIENGESPDYAPTLFHWGTSVIMDGTFDDDNAYLFTAPSKALSFTNGETSTVTTTGASSLIGEWNYQGGWRRNWYVRIPVNASDATKFYSGLQLYTADGSLNGQEVDYTAYSGGTFYVYIYVAQQYSTPAVYPTVGSAVSLSLGVPAAGGNDETVNLGTDTIPLVSLRLAPSVDSNISGNLGERDIINRMQLKLAEVGLIITHDCEVKLILNGDLSTISWENVASPSLSQLIKHNSADTVTGGTEVFSFRATGGATDNQGVKLTNATNFKINELIDLGNSILGGDGTFPNGPDIITVAVKVVDTGGIGASNPFKTSGRITWSESQA